MLLRAVSDKLSLLKMLIWNIDTKKEKQINRERKDRKGIDFRLDKAIQLIRRLQGMIKEK